ncbi:histidine phosphatase family protein [bacterium]|nr:histidine phosphatase family protein [bacterium]
MKRLILIRHSKSNWDDSDVDDYNRSLSKRGARDANFMSELLAKKIDKPDLIITSPATRAVKTAEFFADAFDIDDEKIISDIGIYERGSKYIIQLLKDLDNSIQSVMIIGHNPDITTLSNYLSGEYYDNIPTTGIIGIDFSIQSWSDLESKQGKLILYETPKKYSKKSK